MLLGLVLQQPGNVGQLVAILGEAVHLQEVLAVVELAEEGVLLALAADARVRVVPRVLALAVQRRVTLRQAGPPPSAQAESANIRPFYGKRAGFSLPPPAT